jgi:hypothetical protein
MRGVYERSVCGECTRGEYEKSVCAGGGGRGMYLIVQESDRECMVVCLLE